MESKGIHDKARDKSAKLAYAIATAAFDDLLPEKPSTLKQLGKGHEDVIQDLL